MGCVGHRTFAFVFGIFVVMFERVRARLYCYGSEALHKGRIPRTFRASAHPIARTHSPEVLSPYVLKASAMNMVGLPSEV